MSTILQPCFESQLFETTTVKLKFAPPNSVEFGKSLPCLAATDAMEHREKCHQLAVHVGGNTPAKTDLGCLSFLQVLSDICSNPKETMEKESAVYVHPLSKRSSPSRLSEKSYEMCTENLGSETGTEIMDSSILSLSPSFNSAGEKSSPREYSKNKVNTRNFPPPLTTISGANSLQVRPHREGGRLVIRAFETPVKHTYLQAERSHGRLRLCLLEYHAGKLDSQVTAEENEANSEDDEIDVVEKHESSINDEALQENQELEYQKEGDEDDGESDAQMNCNMDMDGNNFDIEVEMGMEKFQRLSRCNEGGHSNKGLYNWKPLCVATS